MVVGGLPSAKPDHVERVAGMALGMRDELSHHGVPGFGQLRMRLGNIPAQSSPGSLTAS